MKLRSKLAAGLAVLAMGAVPSVAGATGPEYAPEHPTHPEGSPNGHAYGYYCQGESKKHVAGTPGTPYSACVKAAARAAHHEQLTAREACKALSKKHVKGQQGTPFSVCVKGVAQMQREQHRKEREEKEAQS